MNEAQQGRLRTVLLFVNRTIVDLERVVREPGADEIVYRWRNRLPEAGKKEALRLAKSARAVIRHLAERHGIEPIEDSPIRTLQGALAAHWVAVEDTRTNALRRCGPVDAELAKTLDPDIDELAALVNAMRRALLDKADARGSRA